MSLEQFEQSYFYANELKDFAKTLGLKVGFLRKNEVEQHIKAVLSGDNVGDLPRSAPNRAQKGSRDMLRPDALVVNYVSDKETKSFLKEEIAKIDPDAKAKSGQWYWLNDWRKEQLRNDCNITYQDLVNRLYELMTINRP